MVETTGMHLAEKDLETNDPPGFVWVLVRDAARMLWKGNPKLHDVGGVMESIRRHGFQDVPKLDRSLGAVEPGMPGAIKSGNGRVEALSRMEARGGELPRGLAATADGAWAMPLLVGTDAVTAAAARAYAVDANNLVMSGGDFTALDMLRAWDRAPYLELLEELAGSEELPVSADGDVLDALLSSFEEPEAPEDFPEYDDDIDVEYRCPKCGYEWSGSQT